MDKELKKAVGKSHVAMQASHPKERSSFKLLTLLNPNYFGNLAESPFTPVLPLVANTFYEAIGCVGYHPQQQRLEAVVYVHQPSGYGSDICGPGSTEFVRFYLSFDSGASWEDQGVSSFQAYDIPQGTEGANRLEYAVTREAQPPAKLCVFNPLIRVRAILSWNNPPPANQPNWQPVWGNVREANILVEPLRLLKPPHLFDLAKVKIPPSLGEIVDLEAPIPTAPKMLAVSHLATLYGGKGVPVHRFAFKELMAFHGGLSSLSAEDFVSAVPGIKLDPDIIKALFPPEDGDTSYEELKCIGLDPNSPDTLVAIIQIKKSSGYSGGPCTSGSQEYVTFWADFDGNGSFEVCLGVASVRVYDLTNVPQEGVYYAARLPVDLTAHRKRCQEGPTVVRIRAILSWNVAVPCATPNAVPTWGNREETLINVAPSASAPAGRIAILGGIPVSLIDAATGLTAPDAVFATNNLAPDALGRPCPFAGRVSVQGVPLPGYSYLVEVSPDGVLWTPVLTDLIVTDQNGNVSPHHANAVTSRFDYLPFNQNVNGLLAQWDTSGDARWRVRLSVYDGAGTLQSSDTHLLQLDNTWPEASIEITTGTGDCGKFTIGTLLAGDFTARDDYLASYGLSVEPAVNPAGVGEPVPGSGFANTAPSPGDPWSLDTSGMRACGYVVRLTVSDRAIVNSQSVGHHTPHSVGFCLEEPTTEEA